MRKLKAFLLLLPLFLVLLVPALPLGAESAQNLTVRLSDAGTGVAAGMRPNGGAEAPCPSASSRALRASTAEMRPAAQRPQPLPQSGLRMGRAELSEPGPVPGEASPSVAQGCDRMAARSAVPVGEQSEPYGHRQQGCATEGYGLETELLDMLAGLVPEGWEGWLALGFGLCALLSVILPEPSESAHPALKCGHRALCVLGLGASRLKAAGRLGKLVSLGKRLRP